MFVCIECLYPPNVITKFFTPSKPSECECDHECRQFYPERAFTRFTMHSKTMGGRNVITTRAEPLQSRSHKIRPGSDSADAKQHVQPFCGSTTRELPTKQEHTPHAKRRNPRHFLHDCASDRRRKLGPDVQAAQKQ